MKKQILCTSALALGALTAAPASAAEWDLKWGGFFSTFVVYTDARENSSDGLDGVRVLNTGEIQFTPSITLDNGLTFGINVQFEAAASPNGNGGNNLIDESFLEVSSDTFGRLLIGGENSAGYLLSTGAPVNGGFFVNSPSYTAFIPASNNFAVLRAAGSSSFSEVGRNNDLTRITYFTPSFNGLTLGASYAPNNNSNGTPSQGFANDFSLTADSDAPAVTLEDIWDVGANYSQSFGNFGVRLSARYGEGDGVNGGSDADLWQIGASFDFAGFTLGGSYGESDNTLSFDEADQTGWSVGINYDIPGPWSVGFETYQGRQRDGSLDSDLEVYKLGASREVGPGVSFDVFVVQVEATNEDDRDLDEEGTLFGTAINLSF